MSVDIVKQLEKAKRFVEKSRIDDAIEAYQSVLAASPEHLEAMQSLGDLFTRQNKPDRAALLDEALGLFQLFDDVHAHAGSDGFP